jgi:predicted dehydrogenase
MTDDSKKLGRREFLGTTAAAVGTLMLIRPELVRGTQANSAVRLGLIGCGGRGRADATSIVRNTTARLVALADIFDDQLQSARAEFNRLAASKGNPAIDSAMLFKGPRAFEKLLASSEVDAVVIASPPYYHPEHLEAAVAAGKHVYQEKPVAVDVHGCKQVMRIGDKAQGKITLNVGFQIRKAPPFVELVKRIHTGQIGKIACAQAYYYTGTIKRPDWPSASPAEKRLRNWVYDRVLSGDILVEQGIHVVDICNWVLQGHPLKAYATGGRGIREDQGDAWGHYNATYFYPGDIHVSMNSTQFNKGFFDVAERFFGSKGTAEAHYSPIIKIMGDEPWDYFPSPDASGNVQFSATGRFSGSLDKADEEKHKSFIESITTGANVNEAQAGAESALTAILARTAAYTSKEVTWEALLKSDAKSDSKLDLAKL